MSREDDPDIPEDVDPGGVSTFWWTELEERARTRAAGKSKSDEVASKVDTPIKGERLKEEFNSILDSFMLRTPRNDVGKEERHLSAGGSTPRPSKRSRVDSQSDNEKRGDFVYLPVSFGNLNMILTLPSLQQKCDHCEERGWVCYVACAQDSGLPVGGARCLPCKYKKCRCSAISNPDIHRRVKNVSAACSSISAKTKPVTTEKSIIEMIRSQKATKVKEEQANETVSESNEPQSTTTISASGCAPPSAKRQRVFVAVPPSTFKAATGAADDSDDTQPQSSRIGPPGGKWKREKRAELEAARVEASKSAAAAPPLPLFESAPTAKTSVSVGTITSPRSTITPEINDEIPAQCPNRVMVDRGIATEEQPLRQQNGGHHVEFLKGLMKMIQATIQIYESCP
ncbi:hypothetical protein JVU11DRAFT_9531 [Chiua virens]|nr:hypothetical protein JVU11DRAFT_9531 [Chiua virens]